MHNLDELKEMVEKCYKCRLGDTRNNLVFGQGNENADIMFIGEGPGYHEDMKGLAFVGPAGQLLTKALEGINLTRDQVYIGNIVKCRSPNNRNPKDDEMEACIQYLRWQVKIIKPKIIVCLGSISSKNIIDKNLRITKEREKWVYKKGIWIMPTYHPSAVLRDEKKKRPFWMDFKNIREKYEEIS
ncbi:uracil-DNA glycosylase [Anaeromicrobium sediminis]|uniref:Type-4 uracil-DNA glycosylase n=1 Tax=Anaeromicrobium sediminis TaxID=1478221 RepID=A0A267MI69_9FIRM|nr:uracil-DNA glycosylase [Anaeromicrobium sediminis]PAB58493.1 uracil-DNA glycosylase [Anaeromicrobium sediminis]